MSKTTSAFLLCTLLSLAIQAKAAEGFILAKLDKSSFPKMKQGDAHRCSEYFFAFPAFDQHGPVVNYIQLVGSGTLPALTERDQFRVIIDNTKPAPKAQTIADPDGVEGITVILRISMMDYQAARTCLPKPSAPK